MPDLSVIICTHNPRPDYLRRVLDALRTQTLPYERWELLLIDNASKEPLVKSWDLSWHPHARHVREDKLGLTPARLRGIKESVSELMIFVDDDNVLAENFLEASEKIAAENPRLGAFGAGNISGEYEIPPPQWSVQYVCNLAIREWPRDMWGNTGVDLELPIGAGLCVKRVVALAYNEAINKNSYRGQLDRTGNSLISAGDVDLAITAWDVGLGTGVFVALKIKHLIPSMRLEENYMARLIEGQSFSATILQRLGRVPKPLGTWRHDVLVFIKTLFMIRIDRRMAVAHLRGKWRANRFILS